MTTLALQTNKNCTKLILYSTYAVVLSFLTIPQRYILYQNNPAIASPNIQYGHISKDFYEYKTESENKYTEKQKWDKSTRDRYKQGVIYDISEGVKHIKLTKHISSGNVKINVIEINKKINPNLEVAPVLAAKTLSNKATIKNLATKSKAIVAINATYFKPQNGIPLGTLMIDKKLYTGPIFNRVALGIEDNGFVMEKYQLNAKLKYKNIELNVDNINQPRMLSTYVLIYTSDWGKISPKAPKYGINIAIEDGKIIQASKNEIKIPENGFVISAPKSKADIIYNAQIKDEKQVFLANLLRTRKIKLEIKNDKAWEKSNHIVSGGPFLIKNGEIFVDAKEQKLLAITGRNPRTAIGYTENNEFIMMTIDGREQNSIGMTLEETAKQMKDFGCIWAMNLDGGGSSVMYVKDKIVNTPGIKGGIAISNALVIREG